MIAAILTTIFFALLWSMADDFLWITRRRRPLIRMRGTGWKTYDTVDAVNYSRAGFDWETGF